MHKSKLIDHVSSTTMTDVSRIATPQEGRLISLLGRGNLTRMSRAGRHGRNPRTGAFSASGGVRLVPGSPYSAALNAKSGASMAASAKAATGPAGTLGSMSFIERRD